MKYAIIGGTGFYGLEGQENKELRVVETAYGRVEVYILSLGQEEVVFLPRHGLGHSLAPNKINYRANIQALKKLGVDTIYTTAAVGSCNRLYKPGDLVIVEDFIDFTKDRPLSFFQEEDQPVVHIDMGDPYCSRLRENFSQMAQREGLEIKGGAVYACTEGPRFETAAEIRMFEKLGADVVGMTSVPEVVLAKELGICYATIGIITNWCTGFQDQVDHGNIRSYVEASLASITKIFFQLFDQEPGGSCSCQDNLVEL